MTKQFMIALCAAFALTACSREAPESAPEIDIEAGRLYAEEKCVACHAADGSGRTAVIPNLAAQPADYLLDAMSAYQNGQRHHAALQSLFENMPAADMRNLAGFFASLPPVAAIPKESAQAFYREGMQVAEACVECHGPIGFSETPGVPNLAGQHPMYLILATQEYANGTRENADKARMLEGLQQVDIEKMALYFASQTPEQREPPSFGDPLEGEAQSAMCGSCHGARGISDDPLIPNLAGQEPNYLVMAIKAYRDDERSHEGMVTAKTDQQIKDIAAFYAIQRATRIAEDDDIAGIIAKCDRCHGESAGSTDLVVPSLNGQNSAYLLYVMKEYRDGRRGNSMMHKMSASFSDHTLSQIAEHYAAQSR